MPRSVMHQDYSLARLRRIEGQVRGLQRMIEDDTYCSDVLCKTDLCVHSRYC